MRNILIDFTNNLGNFYFQIYVLDNRPANNYYSFISIKLFLILLYTDYIRLKLSKNI